MCCQNASTAVSITGSWILIGLLWLSGCCTPTTYPPPSVAFSEMQPNIGRGGRAVAISVMATNSQVAIAAGESGGLFKTSDGGSTWSHIDTFPPYRMSDVAFAPLGLGNGQIVVATAQHDSNPDPQMNQGGVWASLDAGGTWSHIVPATSCFSNPASGYGIAFLAPSSVFVATDCGLVTNINLGATNWIQLSNWTVHYGSGLESVVASLSSGQVVIDVCRQGGGHVRSQNGGNTWSVVHWGGPDCQSAHSLAASPLEANVLFATSGGTVVESDDGGVTWGIDLGASSYNERPKFVATRPSADKNGAHFDFYYSGRMTTCSNAPAATGQRCPSNTGNSWIFLPNIPGTNINHDINGVAFDSATDCAMFEASDFGVIKKGPPLPGQPCGDVSAWTLISNAADGFGALQLYQIAGQVQFPITGPGINVSGHTSLFIGTMDNMNHLVFDAGATGWQSFGAEGSFLQVLSPTTTATKLSDYELTLVDFGGRGFGANKVALNTSGGWSGVMQPWTSANPPGNDHPPFLVAPSIYVQWSGNVLYLTRDAGATWTAAGTLPAGLIPFNSIQIASTPTGPAVYEVVGSNGGALGVGLLAHLLQATAPSQFEMRTLSGTNNRGLNSGLRAIWGNCFGQGSWYCQPVFAADPNDYRHLFAVDPVRKVVLQSTDAGETWNEDFGLTRLVQVGGISMADSLENSQVHTIAFDPSNSSHILAGTDQAGIFASANGGATWSFLPDTAKATAITSFFFDNRTDVVYVGTYGRGLWKLAIDWTTVH